MERSDLVVLLLVLVQAVSVIMLWSLDSLSRVGQDVFSLFLATDLVSLALVAYTYRTSKEGIGPARLWVVAGCLAILLLLFTSLFVSW
jgi:hypothetical protein